jgi:hypothetical protein
MAPFKQDSRSTTIVQNPPSISAPRRLNSQAEHRSKLPSALVIRAKGNSHPDDCNPTCVDRVRQRTDSVSSTASTIIGSRPQSKLHSIMISASSSLRRHSSDETRPLSGAITPKAVNPKARASTKSVVEFPKVISFPSSIPVRSPAATKINERKRLLSRNEEEEVQPRVRQRLRSPTCSVGSKSAPFHGSNKEEKADQDRSRSVSIGPPSGFLDPGPGGPTKGVLSVTDIKSSTLPRMKSSITTLRSVESKDDSGTRRPFTHTQVSSIPDISKSYLFSLGSAVEEVLSNDTVNLAYRHNDEAMRLEDLEEIPDLPLSRPSSVINQNSARSNLERFNVKITSNRDTEVWDTDEKCAFGSLADPVLSNISFIVVFTHGRGPSALLIIW